MKNIDSSINVYAGFVRNYLINRYLLPLNEVIYQTFLELLQDVPLSIRCQLGFQHDRAQFGSEVNRIFGNRCIATKMGVI